MTAASILQNISDEEYERTRDNPITHEFSYRTQSGYLRGIKPNQDAQKITLKLQAGQPGIDITEMQILLAAILQRHAVFGPIYQYPKIYVIGPEALEDGDFTPRANVALPYARDVDRVIWIRRGSGPTTYEWGAVHLLHNYREELQVIKFRAKQYVNYSPVTAPTKLIKSILRNGFADSSSFAFGNIGDLSFEEIRGADHFRGLWMLHKMAMDRIPDWDALKVTRPGEAMKKMGLLGIIPFVEPSNETQSEHPVPLGSLKMERLVRISDHINRPAKISEPLITFNDDDELDLDFEEDGSSINSEEHISLNSQDDLALPDDPIYGSVEDDSKSGSDSIGDDLKFSFSDDQDWDVWE